jgi:Helix-turn-helix domain
LLTVSKPVIRLDHGTTAENPKRSLALFAAKAAARLGGGIMKANKSTACEAQRERIMIALRESAKTSHDLRRLGCYQAPARIKELRDRYGHNIRTERVTLYDSDGYMHRGAARYHLIEEAADIVDAHESK